MEHEFIYCYWLMPDKNSPNDITKAYIDDGDLVIELIDNLTGEVLNYVKIYNAGFIDIMKLMMKEL